MKVIFFGSPEFAVPTLEALLEARDIDVCSVITQRDKPAGRGMKLRPPVVKVVAQNAGIPVRQPRSIRGSKFEEWCRVHDADAFVVVAYGKILPKNILDIPRLGCVNLHASLLPKYRGAAPVNWALVNGETVTGVTTMLMDEGMDTGPILLKKRIEILPEDTTGSLVSRLAAIGAPLTVETLRELAAEEVTPQPQDDSLATSAPLLKKEDGLIDWHLTATEVLNRWRGFSPWPGIYTFFRNEQLKLKGLRIADDIPASDSPGTIHISQNHELLVSCGKATTAEIVSAQMPGRKAVAGADLINGLRIREGEVMDAK